MDVGHLAIGLLIVLFVIMCAGDIAKGHKANKREDGKGWWG